MSDIVELEFVIQETRTIICDLFIWINFDVLEGFGISSSPSLPTLCQHSRQDTCTLPVISNGNRAKQKLFNPISRTCCIHVMLDARIPFSYLHPYNSNKHVLMTCNKSNTSYLYIHILKLTNMKNR